MYIYHYDYWLDLVTAIKKSFFAINTHFSFSIFEILERIDCKKLWIAHRYDSRRKLHFHFQIDNRNNNKKQQQQQQWSSVI